MAGVVCTQCGASTPLPEDLRVATFACQFCRAELSTASYAGVGAVRVDEMRAFFNAVVEAPSALKSIQPPKLVHGDGGTREGKCAHCGAPLAIPLTITTHSVTCASCGKTEPINRYIGDAERMQLDIDRQVAGNQAVAELLRTGVSCPKCGAPNALSEPISVQHLCTTCGHAILLSDFVPADAIDRARLKQIAHELKRGIAAQAAARQRASRFIVIGVIALVLVAVGVAAFLQS